MNALISGLCSEIGNALGKRLSVDGWGVMFTDSRGDAIPEIKWDLMILSQGKLSPIGKFFETDWIEWTITVSANGCSPLLKLREVWPMRNPGATVVFLSGPNMAKPSPTYTAYRAGKAIIESLVETLGVEYPDTRFRILRPGVVRTKIHEQTLAAGDRAANYERVKGIMDGTEPTVSHDEVYEKLKALL